MAKCRVQLGVSGCRCQAQWGCNGGAESSLAERQWGLRLGLTLEVMRAAAGGAGWEGCSGNREVRCCSWTPQREALSAGVRSWSEAATAGGALRGHHLLRPQGQASLSEVCRHTHRYTRRHTRIHTRRGTHTQMHTHTHTGTHAYTPKTWSFLSPESPRLR